MNYTVYMHVNKINGKKYIGITKQKPEERWKNGNGYKPTSHFRHAIDKYGWSNFDHIILFTNLSSEEASKKERELIQQYNTTNHLYGYNNSNGGEIAFTYKHSEEAKQKMSESAKKRGIQTNCIEAMKKANIKQVRCIETNKIYESASAAAREMNIKNHISECCHGHRKTCGGFHWEFI